MHPLRTILLLYLLLLLGKQGNAQQYLVFFSHKGATTLSLQQPQAFLSANALERRQRYNIAIDSTDLPVPQTYLEQLRSIPGLTVLQSSRWLNAAAVRVSSNAVLQQAQNLPFVSGSRLVRSTITGGGRVFKPMQGSVGKIPVPDSISGIQQDFYQYGGARNQLALHKGQFLHNIGLRGEGIPIGILDAGFFRYTQLPAFDSVRSANRVLGTWDLVAGDTSVVEDNAHGMQCFSIIAANMPGRFVGAAPEASFYLLRTEDAGSESQTEELFWVAAAERLDSAGALLISSSLGYNQFDGRLGNYSYADMNGDITLSARGADLAARKGMLVVNSAGNSGNGSWKYITTPADGDSVLAVGAVNSNGVPANFSSFGPAADGRVKPDVAAMGVNTTLQATNGTIGTGNGTSFACPVISGLAACLWQGFPERTNWDIMEAIRLSGSRAAAPDDRTGYGIPDMQKAVGLLLQQSATAEGQVEGCLPSLSWQSKDMQAMRYVVERRDGNSSWQAIATIVCSGRWAPKQYRFTDRSVLPSGPVSYRIQQVLDTAAVSYYAIYLDTLQLTTSGSCQSGQRIQVVSAPGAPETVVLLNFQEAVPNLHLEWFNSLGQQIGTWKGNKPAGVLQTTLPTSRLAAGSYYLRAVEGQQQIASTAFLKL